MDRGFSIGNFVLYATSIGKILRFEMAGPVKGAEIQWMDDSVSWVALSDLRLAEKPPQPDKADYTLLPWDALEEVTKVFACGAAKYSAHDWAKPDNGGGDHLKAALRHIVAHLRGDTLDDPALGGTGLRHLSHATARLLMAVGKEMRN